MGDSTITLVPRKSEVQNKEQKIKNILEWLIEIDAIESQKTTCVWDDLGYRISKGAEKIVLEPDYLPFELTNNGLEIITEGDIFTAMEGGINILRCPNCKENIVEEDWDLNEWASSQSNNLTCPKCTKSENIHLFEFDPQWGFSDLGFTFWNWPEFTDLFIRDFESRLGMEIDIVYAHL